MHVRALAAVATACALLSAPPAVALAHEGNSDYRSEVSGIEPATPGIEVQMLNFDDSLLLTNGSDSMVVIEGYEGEPYLRISPDGLVEANTRSPAYYLNDDRYANVEVPENADPKADPAWKEVGTSGQYAWHDHRAHYMGTGIPQQVTDQAVRTEVFDYQVPIAIDGRPASIGGTLYWAGDDDGPPLAPFVALGCLALLGAGGVAVIRRRRGTGEASLDGEEREAW